MGGRAGWSRTSEIRTSYFTGEPADTIFVGLYHQILLCPFRFRRGGDVGAPWTVGPLFDPEGRDRDDSARPAYSQVLHAERAYFHPFVREFLYGQKRSSSTDGAANPAIRRFKRDDVRWAVVTYYVNVKSKWETRPVALRVRRVELYLFDTGTGIFVVELDNRLGPHAHADLLNLDEKEKRTDGSFDVARGKLDLWRTSDAFFANKPFEVQRRLLTLADVLWLQDQLRRLYAPYWESKAGADGKPVDVPGHCVRSVRWLNDSGEELAADEVGAELPAKTDDALPAVNGGKFRLFEWWRRLLHPLIVRQEPIGTSAGKAPVAELLGDERMGVMTYLAIEDHDATKLAPRQIGDGDWMRLATQEQPGEKDVFPYAPGFFADAVPG